MSGFFEHLKSVGMPYIRKSGGTNDGLVRTAATLMDDAKEDIRWLRYQFFPQLCDDELLLTHADARGIERYPYESDEFFRNRVAAAFQFYLRGGAKAGVNEFLEAIGLDAHTVEYHEYTGDIDLGWAEFLAVVNIESLNQTVEHRQFLAKLLNELKPARSRLVLIIWTLDIPFTVPAPVVTLEIADYVDFAGLNGIDVHNYPTIDGSWQLDGSRTLTGGWGDLTITDL